MWDDELTSFFKELPYTYKCEPYFFEECLLNTIFKEYIIAIIPPDKIGRNNLKAQIKRKIKQFVPKWIIDLRTKIIFKDINNINYMSKPLLTSDNKLKDSTNIDKVIVNWIISRIND